MWRMHASAIDLCAAGTPLLPFQLGTEKYIATFTAPFLNRSMFVFIFHQQEVGHAKIPLVK